VEVREGSPEFTAVTSNARAAARRAAGRDAESVRLRTDKKHEKKHAGDGRSAVGDARVVSVWRVVAPDASSTADQREEPSSGGSQKRWGYVGLAPAATLRALGANGLDASVKTHRTLAEAYEASKRALASGARANPPEEELASLLDGPAALLACEVWLTREEAALWDASPARGPRMNVGFDVEREKIARVAYVVHAERARLADSDAESDSNDDEDDTARRGLRLTRRDVPEWFTRDDDDALRALEDAADAATREYLHDAWTALDPLTGAALAAQDDELSSLRDELREVRARIAEERLAQDDIARSLRKVTFVE
jgi:hypothetical protein